MFNAPTAGIHLLLPGSCDSLATWIEQVSGTVMVILVLKYVAAVKLVTGRGAFQPKPNRLCRLSQFAFVQVNKEREKL